MQGTLGTVPHQTYTGSLRSQAQMETQAFGFGFGFAFL